ncbi:Uncharacterised protein [Sphingobacterium spiritivorum]|uniref:Uncharacterized protein n=1 Tax=Sphingobacterium spiritivorum ATCC 33861 TaxID=525373 RepID=D7VHU0_SPHSI|nr:hypothetical protein HMPREF0766_10559 [Sphingobacterium spiritivorum ATCC 33861]SUI97486.1 Uncharacterised protein [Sphingobacterium spiritivorum]
MANEDRQDVIIFYSLPDMQTEQNWERIDKNIIFKGSISFVNTV